MNRKYLRLNLISAISLIAAFICPAGFVHGIQLPDSIAGRVVRVHDGDTVSVVMVRKSEKIRLLGIDAPELGQRPWGKRAKDHLKEIIEKSGGIVVVEFDIERRDRYGRLLAYLWTRDRHLINYEMVRDGYAMLYTFPPNVKYTDMLKRGQRIARENKAGIWGSHGLKERPSSYRKSHPD